MVQISLLSLVHANGKSDTAIVCPTVTNGGRVAVPATYPSPQPTTQQPQRKCPFCIFGLWFADNQCVDFKRTCTYMQSRFRSSVTMGAARLLIALLLAVTITRWESLRAMNLDVQDPMIISNVTTPDSRFGFTVAFRGDGHEKW